MHIIIKAESKGVGTIPKRAISDGYGFALPALHCSNKSNAFHICRAERPAHPPFRPAHHPDRLTPVSAPQPNLFSSRALIPDSLSRPRVFLCPPSDRVLLHLSRCSAFPWTWCDFVPRETTFVPKRALLFLYGPLLFLNRRQVRFYIVYVRASVFIEKTFTE